jgi:hypothetical protein
VTPGQEAGDRAPDVRALAELIAGDGRPVADWLERGLQMAVAGVAFVIRKDASHPPRASLRLQLRTAVDAARFLRRCLEDLDFQRTLAEAGGDDYFGDLETFHGLDSVIERAEKALAKFPSGQGPHKHAPGTNAPLITCAFIVAVAWRCARGKLPGYTSGKAQEACRLLWSLAGGPPRGWGSQALAGWRRHLKAAMDDLEKGTNDGPEKEHRLKVECLFQQEKRTRPAPERTIEETRAAADRRYGTSRPRGQVKGQ